MFLCIALDKGLDDFLDKIAGFVRRLSHGDLGRLLCRRRIVAARNGLGGVAGELTRGLEVDRRKGPIVSFLGRPANL